MQKFVCVWQKIETHYRYRRKVKYEIKYRDVETGGEFTTRSRFNKSFRFLEVL